MNKIMVLSLLVVLVLAGRTEAMNPDPADFALDATGTITWLIQPGPNMNVARMGQNSASLDDGRVILFGGRGTGFISLDSAESYDLQTNSFTQLHMNYPHDSAALAKLLDGRYIIAGGSSNMDL